jgi:serine/threonine protein kinase
MDIAVLSTKDRMKCEVFREMSTPSFREKDKAERMYVNSKIQFVEGTSLSSYFRKILQGDGVGQELSPFFVTRFIRSYRHLLKAVRLLQAGATSNSVIIHHDLKDGNIMYDTKRGVPIIIDFGISFDRSVFDESTHPKKLGNVFYKYFNRYAPWSIDVVILAYIAKVVLLRNGEGDDSIKEIYEKETIAVDDLKKVCDDFFENNEILKWVDTLTGGNNNTVASPTPSHNTSTDTNPNPNPANTDINAAENTNSNPNPANTNINAAENTNPNPNPANTDTNASTSAAAKNDDKVAPKGVIDNIKNLIFGSKNVETSQTGSLNKDVDGVAFDSTRNKMKSQWNTYIDSFNRKVWKELVVDLSQRYASWDVYSLSVCYLQYIHQLELLGGKYQVPDVFMEFVEELKTVF